MANNNSLMIDFIALSLGVDSAGLESLTLLLASMIRSKFLTEFTLLQPAFKVLTNELMINQRWIGIDDAIQFVGLVGRQDFVRIKTTV